MKKRRIRESEIILSVKELCIKAGIVLRPDVISSLKIAHEREKSFSKQKDMLGIIMENIEIAKEKK